MPEYYTVVDDFGNIEPNIGQLDNEIRSYIIDNPLSITPSFYGISSYINNIDISLPPYITIGKTIVEFHFNLALSGPEKTILDGLVSSHVAVFTTATNEVLIITSNLDTTKHSTYRRVNKPISLTPMSYAIAKSITYMESGVTSYDIRFHDKTNNTILLETNLTNTDESEQNLGELSNLSSESWILEISVKKNGGSSNSKVYLESFKICYN